MQTLVIKQQAVLQAKNEQIRFRSAESSLNIAPAFTELVLEQLDARYPLDQLARSGMRVVTTLDYDFSPSAVRLLPRFNVWQEMRRRCLLIMASLVRQPGFYRHCHVILNKKQGIFLRRLLSLTHIRHKYYPCLVIR
jgi:hypothetical protein